MGVSRQRVAAAGVLAVKHINERNSVLVPSSDELHPDFSLDYEIADTFSTPGRGVQLSIEFQQAGVQYIVGASRSAVTAPVSLVASTNDIPVISYASTAPELSEKSTHPLFSRSISNDETTALAITISCYGLGWRNIAGALQISELDAVWCERCTRTPPPPDPCSPSPSDALPFLQ
eukprot:136271-Rhodomonas_salina.2